MPSAVRHPYPEPTEGIMPGPTPHIVLVEFTGDVFSLYVEMEGTPVDLQFDGVNKWTRTFANFSVDGPLDFYYIAKGLSGTACALAITVDGTALPVQQGTIPGSGVLVGSGSLDVSKATPKLAVGPSA
jgi:hypothetical protein